MHRQPLLSLLQHYTPLDAHETQMWHEILDFVREYPNCFERSLAIGHITASAWITNQQGTLVLMTHHRKLDRWLQLGGHADGETDAMQVALTEAKEESGLQDIQPASEAIFDVDVHVIPQNGEASAHKHYDIRFLFQADASQPLYRSERESKQLKWLKEVEILQLNQEESIRRMVEKMKRAEKKTNFYSCINSKK